MPPADSGTTADENLTNFAAENAKVTKGIFAFSSGALGLPLKKAADEWFGDAWCELRARRCFRRRVSARADKDCGRGKVSPLQGLGIFVECVYRASACVASSSPGYHMMDFQPLSDVPPPGLVFIGPLALRVGVREKAKV